MAFENDKIDGSWKTIDKERNITLTEKGLDKELVAWDFELDVKGKKNIFHGATAWDRGRQCSCQYRCKMDSGKDGATTH
jgi:hypothetical protein